jgi:hypothetical protein
VLFSWFFWFFLNVVLLIKGSHGEVEIFVPRDRSSSFETIIILIAYPSCWIPRLWPPWGRSGLIVVKEQSPHMWIHSIRNQDRRLSPNLAILFPTPFSHWLRGTPTPTGRFLRNSPWAPLTLQLFWYTGEPS